MPPATVTEGAKIYLLVLKISRKGAEDGSVGKVLALNEEGPEFEPQNPPKESWVWTSEMVPR